MATTAQFVRVLIQPCQQGVVLRQTSAEIGNKSDPMRQVDVQIPLNNEQNLDSLKQLLICISQNQATANSWTGIGNDFGNCT